MTSNHSHCEACFSLYCSSFEGCLYTSCPACSINLHECKLEDHQLVCQEATVSCINSDYGCTARLKRHSMPRHLTEDCSLIHTEDIPSTEMVSCQHCSQTLQETDLNDHYLICDFMPVPCTNASFGCSLMLRRIDINSHLKSCPASIIQCLYAHTRAGRLEEEEVPFRDKNEQPPDEKFLLHDKEASLHSSLLTFTPRRSLNFYPMLQGLDDEALARGKEILWDTSLVCGRFVRRDQYESHLLSHLELVDDLPLKIRRCPLTHFGCTHGTVVFQPSPMGSILDYNKGLGSFYITQEIALEANAASNSQYAIDIARKQELAQYGYGEDGEGSYDVLGQLPLEILLQIMSHLDSLSLWSLSQVNRYIRSMCEDLLTSRGIVYFYWRKMVSLMSWEMYFHIFINIFLV